MKLKDIRPGQQYLVGAPGSSPTTWTRVLVQEVGVLDHNPTSRTHVRVVLLTKDQGEPICRSTMHFSRFRMTWDEENEGAQS